jgi:hypothetical protein
MVRLCYGYDISTFSFRSSWIAPCRQSPRISLYSYPSARARCIRECLSLGLLVLSWFSSGERVVVLSSALLPELIQRASTWQGGCRSVGVVADSFPSSDPKSILKVPDLQANVAQNRTSRARRI